MGDHTLSILETLKSLHTSKDGLNQSDAEERLKKCGKKGAHFFGCE